jgi:hypothetical protein
MWALAAALERPGACAGWGNVVDGASSSGAKERRFSPQRTQPLTSRTRPCRLINAVSQAAGAATPAGLRHVSSLTARLALRSRAHSQPSPIMACCPASTIEAGASYTYEEAHTQGRREGGCRAACETATVLPHRSGLWRSPRRSPAAQLRNSAASVLLPATSHAWRRASATPLADAPCAASRAGAPRAHSTASAAAATTTTAAPESTSAPSTARGVSVDPKEAAAFAALASEWCVPHPVPQPRPQRITFAPPTQAHITMHLACHDAPLPNRSPRQVVARRPLCGAARAEPRARALHPRQPVRGAGPRPGSPRAAGGCDWRAVLLAVVLLLPLCAGRC